MTSRPPSEAYVWTWLPGETSPVVAGKLTADGTRYVFNYGRSYLDNPRCLSLYSKELPLQLGILPLIHGLSMPGCIRDAAPDAWGRRVIVNKLFGAEGNVADSIAVDELTYLLESGSDRIGALDFQQSPTEYVPRRAAAATLEDLLRASALIDQGAPLPQELGLAIYHGSAIGGARPKALVDAPHEKYVAKFSSSSDLYSVVKAEFIAMRLAALVGLNVAPVRLERAAKRDAILIERFDRVQTAAGWQRKAMVSALTMFELDEMMARYASYEILAQIIRFSFTAPQSTLRELFARLVFNILVGNTDDHARNHAAFWDGQYLTLTPAYDICPQGRTGNEATQAMLIAGRDNRSQLAVCIEHCEQFHLTRADAVAITARLAHGVVQNWSAVCEEARLSEVDRRLLGSRQFFNPYAFEGLGNDALTITDALRAFDGVRST